jgi:TetR/AcrR family transcriptional regulator, cholesterol catabolism regulator
VSASGRTNRRPSDGESRREELLRIAAHVFATKGIASATVRDIAEQAGILSGSLYHHFSSKEEMVREVLTTDPTDQPFREIIDRADTPSEAMRTCILTAVRWVAHNPDVARIFRNDGQYIAETPALAESERGRQANRLLWNEVVARGIADGSFREDLDPDVVVRAMFDGVLASIRWFAPLGDADPQVIGDELAEFYLAGLRSTPRRQARARASARSLATR